MRTNIDLDEKLVNRGLKLSGLRTKKDLVNMALREFLRRKDQKKILELRSSNHSSGIRPPLRQRLRTVGGIGRWSRSNTPDANRQLAGR